MSSPAFCSLWQIAGGWRAILRTQVKGELHEEEISGGKARTTNNEMEMLTVEEALKAVKREGGSIKAIAFEHVIARSPPLATKQSPPSPMLGIAASLAVMILLAMTLLP